MLKQSLRSRAMIYGNIALWMMGLAGCGGAATKPNTQPVTTQLNAVQPNVTPSTTVASQVREEDRQRALFQSTFSIKTVENILVWKRDAGTTTLVASTTDERNTAPTTVWMRVNDAGSVVAKGEIGMSYAHTLRLLDLTADGQPELLIFGENFTGESPGHAPAVNVFVFAPDAQEPQAMLRAGAAMTGEFTEVLAKLYPSEEGVAPQGTLPDDAAVQQVVTRVEQFTPPNQPASPELFLLGLQRATNDELRRAIAARGVQLCTQRADEANARCQTLTVRQLTDAVITSRVRPLLGRLPTASGDVALPSIPLWEGLQCTDNLCKSWNANLQSTVVIEHSSTGNRLERITSESQ